MNQQSPDTQEEKAMELLLLRRNPTLGIFHSLERLKEVAAQIAEAVVQKHLEAIKKDVTDELRNTIKEHLGGKEVMKLKGDTGTDGKTPVKGEDYFTPQELNAIVDTITHRVRPIKGVHYFDGATGPSGPPGVGRRGPQGPPGESVRGPKGKDGSPDTPQEIRDKLQSLKGNARLDAASIKNIEEALPYEYRRRTKAMVKGGVIPVQISDLTSQTDGATKTFTVPVHSRALLVIGSDFPFTYRPTIDFTISGTVLTITSAVAAPSNDATLLFLYAE